MPEHCDCFTVHGNEEFWSGIRAKFTPEELAIIERMGAELRTELKCPHGPSEPCTCPLCRPEVHRA